MKAAERQEREQEALALFISGSTYLEIAAAVGLSTPSAAHKIVEKALRDAAQRRLLLSSEALAIHQERQERLLLAHWGPATREHEPDHRSADLCQRILAQQARLYGLVAGTNSALSGSPTARQSDEDDEGPSDELARIRASRTSSA